MPFHLTFNDATSTADVNSDDKCKLERMQRNFPVLFGQQYWASAPCGSINKVYFNLSSIGYIFICSTS
jgi:hypothetical protein